MTKPVTLSEEAFRVLRSLKRDGESDSDVILRLAAEAGKKKDPTILLRARLKPAFGSWEQYEVLREKMRQADIRKMRRLYGRPKATRKATRPRKRRSR